MSKDEVLAKLVDCAEELRASGVASLHVFGSTVNGRATPNSDLDIFIDQDRTRKFSLFDLVGVKLLIEDRLGVSADVATRESLHPMLRAGIERSAIRVF